MVARVLEDRWIGAPVKFSLGILVLLSSGVNSRKFRGEEKVIFKILGGGNLFRFYLNFPNENTKKGVLQ